MESKAGIGVTGVKAQKKTVRLEKVSLLKVEFLHARPNTSAEGSLTGSTEGEF